VLRVAALGRYGALQDAIDSWKATAEIYTDSPGRPTEPVPVPTEDVPSQFRFRA
jgi:hypothetical protein